MRAIAHFMNFGGATGGTREADLKSIRPVVAREIGRESRNVGAAGAKFHLHGQLVVCVQRQPERAVISAGLIGPGRGSRKIHLAAARQRLQGRARRDEFVITAFGSAHGHAVGKQSPAQAAIATLAVAGVIAVVIQRETQISDHLWPL